MVAGDAEDGGDGYVEGGLIAHGGEGIDVLSIELGTDELDPLGGEGDGDK